MGYYRYGLSELLRPLPMAVCSQDREVVMNRGGRRNGRAWVDPILKSVELRDRARREQLATACADAADAIKPERVAQRRGAGLPARAQPLPTRNSPRTCAMIFFVFYCSGGNREDAGVASKPRFMTVLPLYHVYLHGSHRHAAPCSQNPSVRAERRTHCEDLWSEVYYE